MKDALVDARINKVLALQTDSVAMCEALDSISEFYTSNTLEARRNLRYDLENKNLLLTKKFLAEYGKLLHRIDEVDKSSSEMETACKVLAVNVSEADLNMRSFMQKASELESRQYQYMEQGKEIENFLKKFSLSSDEIDILYNSQIDQNASNTKQFFAALSHLCSAYKDCKNMVTTNSYNAGFELLDVLGRHQDRAFERLFDWVKQKCETIPESSSSEDVDAKLQVSIRYLRNLPAYYSQCQDLVTNCRRSQVVQRFLLALTQGGTSSRLSGAMDLHAHDPVRYVSDMLAWMHSELVSEEEFLTAVFGRNTEYDSHEKSHLDSNLPSEEPMGLSIQELLSRCVQGLGRPLRMRILQALEGRVSIGGLFSLHDLLTFYEDTFLHIVKCENAVHSAVKGSLLECKRCLTTAVNRQTEAMMSSPISYPIDLSASELTFQCARQIQEILKVHSTALSPNYDELDTCSVINVLGNIVQPLLQANRASGQPLEASDLAIYMLNNVAFVKAEFIDHLKKQTTSPVSSLLTLLDTVAASWQEVLTNGEVANVFKKCELDGILLLMKETKSDIPLSKVSGLEPYRITAALSAFYSSLFSQLCPQLDRLQDPALREKLRRILADCICDDYSLITAYIEKLSNGYDPSILTHNIEEVKVLLGAT